MGSSPRIGLSGTALHRQGLQGGLKGWQLRVQATQRAGRAGRTRPGMCFRLYTSDFYDREMAPAAVPEIQRTSLASAVLWLKSLPLAVDVMRFDFLDRPEVGLHSLTMPLPFRMFKCIFVPLTTTDLCSKHLHFVCAGCSTRRCASHALLAGCAGRGRDDHPDGAEHG